MQTVYPIAGCDSKFGRMRRQERNPLRLAALRGRNKLRSQTQDGGGPIHDVVQQALELFGDALSGFSPLRLPAAVFAIRSYACQSMD